MEHARWRPVRYMDPCAHIAVLYIVIIWSCAVIMDLDGFYGCLLRMCNATDMELREMLSRTSCSETFMDDAAILADTLEMLIGTLETLSKREIEKI